MYKKLQSLEKHHQLLASLVIGAGFISVWRGIWGLMDLYIFPGDQTLSYLISFFLGVGVLYISHQKLS